LSALCCFPAGCAGRQVHISHVFRPIPITENQVGRLGWPGQHVARVSPRDTRRRLTVHQTAILRTSRCSGETASLLARTVVPSPEATSNRCGGAHMLNDIARDASGSCPRRGRLVSYYVCG